MNMPEVREVHQRGQALRRRPEERPHPGVRHGRQVPHDLGQDRQRKRASSSRPPASRSTRTTTSTSPRSATTASRCSTRPASSSTMWGKKGSGNSEFGNLHGIIVDKAHRLDLRRRHGEQPHPGVSPGRFVQRDFALKLPGAAAAPPPSAFVAIASACEDPGHAPFQCSSFEDPRIWRQLILAFLGLSALIGICGASGLFFVQQIGTSVSMLADVTSPMPRSHPAARGQCPAHARGLVNAMKRGGDGAQKQLADIESDARRSIDALRELSTRADLSVNIGAIEGRASANSRRASRPCWRRLRASAPPRRRPRRWSSSSRPRPARIRRQARHRRRRIRSEDRRKRGPRQDRGADRQGHGRGPRRAAFPIHSPRHSRCCRASTN